MASPPGPYGPQRIELHSGQSGAVKGILIALIVFGCLVVVPILVFVAGIVAGYANQALAWTVRIVLWLGLWALAAWALLGILRTAAWLEGTTLVVRGAFRTRRCDLAAAPRVELDSVPEVQSVGNGITSPTGRRLPRLTAYDATTGRPVSVQLIDRPLRRWLDPPKLHALADAILAGPRPEPFARQAAWAASGLRAMASDPTGQIR